MTIRERDLRYWQAGVEVLKDYLLSEEMFWPIPGSAVPGGGGHPRLTLGGLLLARARLATESLEPRQEAALRRLDAEMEAVRTRWRSAWGRKAAREYQSRLNQWRNYLDEYRQDRAEHGAFYPQEVTLRAMLQFLEPEAEGLEPGSRRLLDALDRVLRANLVTGEFIWDPELQAGFDRDAHWYLYGSLRG